jgi:hypothetical protein
MADDPRVADGRSRHTGHARGRGRTPAGIREHSSCGRQPGFKRLVGAGDVKDEEPHFLPQLGHVMPSNDADGPLEQLPAQPEFAVERHRRKVGGEPVGRVKGVALPRKELLASPVSVNRLPTKLPVVN